jgi:hypothetical protein
MVLNSEELHANFSSIIITQIPTNREEIFPANANSVVAEKISFHWIDYTKIGAGTHQDRMQWEYEWVSATGFAILSRALWVTIICSEIRARPADKHKQTQWLDSRHMIDVGRVAQFSTIVSIWHFILIGN